MVAMTPTIVSALLLDMDGTLVDSDAVVARVWHGWATANHVDFAEVMRVTPGRPARDSLADLAPWLSPAEQEAEAARLLALEYDDLAGVEATKGALELVAWLDETALPWAVVTSADRKLATRRLTAAGITPPPVTVTASDIARGKPDPEGYLAAAARLGVPPHEALVVEDAIAGVRAGQAAGCTVAGLRGVAEADIPIADLLELVGLLRKATPPALR
jgi:HAD superfamily hydrolase (TIGR01509 family)